jgi:hypothetical protein
LLVNSGPATRNWNVVEPCAPCAPTVPLPARAHTRERRREPFDAPGATPRNDADQPFSSPSAHARGEA